jgi:hypothetical protein
MSASETTGGRLRAYAQFIVAVLYFFLARALARHGAPGLANEQWVPLVEQAMLAFLLVLGYAGLGFWLNRQLQPVREQGWPLRAGWQGEVGLGLAAGWALAVICVLPLTLIGGVAIVLSTDFSAWGWLLADAAFFALLALAEELVFRGYGFQRFAEAVGPAGAALGFAAFYGIMQSLLPGSSHASMAVSIALSLVLSTAYLRSRALWLSWSLNFGWKASRALLFGLALSGVNSHSPLVQGNPMGPFWLTGGGYGLLCHPSRRHPGRLPPHSRSGLPLQRPGHRAGRNSGGHRCGCKAPARGCHGPSRTLRGPSGADPPGDDVPVCSPSAKARARPIPQLAVIPFIPDLPFSPIRAIFSAMRFASMGGSHDSVIPPPGNATFCLNSPHLRQQGQFVPRRHGLRLCACVGGLPCAGPGHHR